MANWSGTVHPAHLEELLDDGRVRCHLSPRNCTLGPTQHGFCGVRANRGGRLVSLNYGKAVHATEETIETEAVNHYHPGERILSMGNIGCMLNCVYCHNWKTSQARYVSDRDVYYYTPEGVVDIARRHGINCLSWTYNDPVVWQEFILDTSKLAKADNFTILYKSAFFITEEAVAELLPYVDIFSISIKSMDPAYYRQYTSGWLEPVLRATEQVFKAGKHVEVSTLMITDISDNEETARRVSEWVLTNLSSRVPVHFVRFHPDYKMRNSVRTPVDRLVRAREIATEMGVEHVYLGNVYDTPWSATYCKECNSTLVTRYGLNAQVVGLDPRGHCAKCGRDAHFVLQTTAQPLPTTIDFGSQSMVNRQFDWHGDVRSLHVQVRNPGAEPARIYHRRRHRDSVQQPWTMVTLEPSESYRYIIAKARPDEIGPEVALPSHIESNLHEVFDRAHFPTVSIEEAGAGTDVSPLPVFSGKQLIN